MPMQAGVLTGIRRSWASRRLWNLTWRVPPSRISYDDREAKGLVSASAVVPINSDRVRLRVRNEAKFYLQLHFEGLGSVEPRIGGYIVDFADHVSKVLGESLPPEALLLLPEGTAEFTVYEPGETLTIKAVFSDLAAFYSVFDPALGLVPIVDLETFAAVRDVLGEGSRFVRSLPDLEKSLSEYASDLLDLIELTSGAGVLLGEKAIKTLANMLVIPAAVEIRKEYLEGRGADISQKAAGARAGVNLVFKFLPDCHYYVERGDKYLEQGQLEDSIVEYTKAFQCRQGKSRNRRKTC